MVNDSRFYYGVGLLIILISFVVFALGFEKRKPRAREIVMLVCMISFAVIGRVIFYMTPQVKPCAAIIIITGIALGKKAGFLTGAMTAFVSNFFMGQGPWTPWQMVAFGLLGYIFGIAYSKRNVGSYIPKKQKFYLFYGDACNNSCLWCYYGYGNSAYVYRQSKCSGFYNSLYCRIYYECNTWYINFYIFMVYVNSDAKKN